MNTEYLNLMEYFDRVMVAIEQEENNIAQGFTTDSGELDELHTERQEVARQLGI